MPANYTTIGVTGHIDHGKTSLVGRLTGIDTDTHPEEKRRGITIDLGFASFSVGEHTFACIDAPGHQKYIGNLLAGVSAVDIGLLVVACDQGIQAQTLEHAAILQTLDVPQLVVALSRVDLTSDQRQAEVTEELQVFLSDYGFDEFPVIPISNVTGEGIDALKQTLVDAASRPRPAAATELEPYFRMPIDRVLNVPGRGLVVAGTVWSGEVRVGDSLQIVGQPDNLRVREIEVHGDMVDYSQAGKRTAINLAGQLSAPAKRGDELVTPNRCHTSRQLLVEVEVVARAPNLRCPVTAQLHTATSACAARLTGQDALQPGERSILVVEPEQPLLVARGQACLFRLPYPVGSIAGGHVLLGLSDELPKRKKRELVQLGQQLASAGPADRIESWVQCWGEWQIDWAWCGPNLGLSTDDIHMAEQSLKEREDVLQVGDRLVSRGLIQRTEAHVLRSLMTRAQVQEDDWAIRDSIAERASAIASPAVVRHAIDDLIGRQQLVELNGRLAIASEKTLLSKKQRAKMEQLIKLFDDNRKPPTAKEAMTQLAITQEAVDSLIRHATHSRVLTDLGSGFYVGTDVLTTLCGELRRLLEQQGALSVAAIRDGWQVTRKHAIPLLEFCDSQGITVRQQDTRIAGPNLDAWADASGELV